MRPVYSADVFAVPAAIFPYAKPQLGFFEPGSRLFAAPGAAGISRKNRFILYLLGGRLGLAEGSAVFLSTDTFRIRSEA